VLLIKSLVKEPVGKRLLTLRSSVGLVPAPVQSRQHPHNCIPRDQFTGLYLNNVDDEIVGVVP
jgi:hypothetical protein